MNQNLLDLFKIERISSIAGFFLFLIIGSLPSSAEAARLYFRSPLGNRVVADQVMPLDVLIDSDRESINAVEAEIWYPRHLLKPVSISDGDSAINFWIERPDFNQDTIVFKGIIPNGYNRQGGLLLRIYFETLSAGTAQAVFDITSSRVLLNDGQGTEARTFFNNFVFEIFDNLPKVEVAEEKDIYPPEDFMPQIGQNELIYEGEYFIAFSAQDKHSGIDHYEIQETRKNKPQDQKWEITESPYLLKDQNRQNYIFIKAVDKSGNERIVEVAPEFPESGYVKIFVYIFGILACVWLLREFVRSLLVYLK